MVPEPAPPPEQAYIRTTHDLGAALRTHPALAEMYHWGIRVEVFGDAEMVRAEAIAINKPNWPTFESRIRSDRWWQPADEEHLQRIATRLAADLRMKWDRWQGGMV